MARVIQARNRAGSLQHTRSLGKQARDESGKHPVNEDDEENVAGSRATTGHDNRNIRPPGDLAMLRSVHKQARTKENGRENPGHFNSNDVVAYAWLATVLPSAA